MSSHGFDPNALSVSRRDRRNYVDSGAIRARSHDLARRVLAWLDITGVTDIATRAPMREDASSPLFHDKPSPRWRC